MANMTEVALLTDRRYIAPVAPDGAWYLANILHDDRLLQAALDQLGLSSVRVDWSRPDEDWSRYRCLVFRTTWDYFDRFAEFTAWLDRVRSQTRLCNELSLIRWNVDKHYLADLGARGIPVVRSRFVERGTAVRLRDLLDQTGWHDAVIKPCVSGSARHTYRINRETADAVDAVIQPLLPTESVILQPFERAIVDHGEDSLMVFGGRFSHAVRKVAKPGDFRVQDDHGGTARPYQPTPAQVELAERAIAACDVMPAYGRVDMIQDDQGRDTVMELELVEPELWLRYHPPAATALAEAIAATLQTSQARTS
jgi:glutathione synthase/RimK-type ligase-like ATP-grasp enzyme